MKNLKRRIVTMLISLTLILTLSSAGVAQAPRRVEVNLDPGLTVLFDGLPQNFMNALGYPVLPMMFEYTTFLPVRALANLFEVPIDWDADTRTVILGEGELQPPPQPREGFPRTGRVSAYVDPGVSIRLDGEYQILTNVHGDRVYPIMFEGTTYLPVRALAGLFDTPIYWDGDTRTILLGDRPEVSDTPPIELAPIPDGWVSAPGQWGIGLGITNGDVRETGFPEQLSERLADWHLYNAMRLPDAVAGAESTAEFRIDLAHFGGRPVSGFAFQWFIGDTTADLVMGSRYRVSVINAEDGEVISHFDWDLTAATLSDIEWMEVVNFSVHGFTGVIDSVIISFRHLGGATISDIWVYDVFWFVLPDTQ